ncbi:hypothetical protein TAMA11512_02180 [Selenomonas sp. TAMA-11512]|uniref:purple acid phosphatase family protein n=1 Tax=Selenomonas sp. TAMA-11512 TaxID=3095337 RepID=UPI003084D742|nr:hypothetical protein TAMA11512_02180 [Selenomonas sp. TAMA-11512]
MIPKLLTRRRFLRRLFHSLIGITLLPLAACVPPVKKLLPHPLLASMTSRGEAAAPVRFLRQLVTKDPAVSRYIAWQSDMDTPMDVELIEAGHVKGSLHPAGRRTLSDGGETNRLYEVLLTDLERDASYRYRIRSGVNAWSDWHEIRPVAHTSSASALSGAPPSDLSASAGSAVLSAVEGDTAHTGAFTALIFPDSQCDGDYTVVHDITSLARKNHPEASLAIFMGDQVDNGESPSHWRGWNEAVSPLIADLPAAVLMGNHETYALRWQMRVPHAHLAYFPLPANGTSLEGYFSSFDCGCCHFILLNTQQEELEATGLVPSLTETQLAWLEDDIAQSTAPWNIVLMHKDIVEYDYPDVHDTETGDISPTGRLFMPHFDRLRIDLVFTAHQHSYRRLGHLKDFARDETGPYYIDTGNCGNCYYDVPFNDRLEIARLPQPERGNYLTLEAARERLTIRCYLADGSPADACDLYKNG